MTQKEAEQARRRFLSEFDEMGDAVFSREDLTFAQLAERYKDARLIPAEYIDGKKVAGHRELSPLTAYLKSLTEYFGKQKIRTIKLGDIEALKLYLIRKPTRSDKKRTAAAVNRELQFLRAVLNFALANGWIDRNPFSDATNGKKTSIVVSKINANVFRLSAKSWLCCDCVPVSRTHETFIDYRGGFRIATSGTTDSASVRFGLCEAGNTIASV